MDDAKRIVIAGRAVPMRGNDIDTDRIIPARYLRTIVFEGLGAHAFEDDRRQLAEVGKTHPFDDARFAEGQILLVNQNFGCGSSREHAPQALKRWGGGIRAVVGESFAEIFQGNCVALGIPCVVTSQAAVEQLMQEVERQPEVELVVDLAHQTVATAQQTHCVQMPEGVRQQFLEGRWDSTTELRSAEPQVRKAAARLPYFTNFE